MIKLKTILIGGGIAAAIILSLSSTVYIYHLKLKAESDQHEKTKAELEGFEEKYEKEKEERKKLDKVRKDYVEQIGEYENEINNLRDDIDRGPKRLLIKADCPAVPRTSANAARTDSGAAELDADARRAYFDLRSGIGRMTAMYNMCVEELKIRSEEKPP